MSDADLLRKAAALRRRGVGGDPMTTPEPRTLTDEERDVLRAKAAQTGMDSVILYVERIIAQAVAAQRAEWERRLSETVRATSRAISGTYPADLDPEAHTWRRVTKVHEEAGEVTEAMLGYLGENPRKGRTHALNDVVAELLDVANAALGAVDHLRPDEDPVALLAEHSQVKWERLRIALAQPAAADERGEE